MGSFIQNDHYKFIFENSLDAILLTRPDGTIYRANPAACKMLQRTEAELVGMGREGVVDREDPRLEPALRERAEKGEIKTELTFVRKDGIKFPVYLTSVLFKDEDGNSWTTMIVRDITLEKQAEQELKILHEKTAYKAVYDYLTGVLNRTGFIEKLQAEMAIIKPKSSMGLIMLDIDRFKQINDSYGHVIGDKILKSFALELSKNIRPNDILGRYGGDEFIICLPDTNHVEAVQIAERLRQHIEKMELEFDARLIKVTASFGVAVYHSTSKEDIDELISRVDNSMYRAKKQRNYVCFAS